MTIEDKAHHHAVEAFREFLQAEHSTAGLLRDAIEQAYLAGAAEALRSQWKDAAKELPEEDVIGRSMDVLVKLSRKNGICDTYRGHTFRGVWHVEAPFKVTSKVLFWMKLPPLPDTEEQ